jgi:hypothetical protein
MLGAPLSIPSNHKSWVTDWKPSRIREARRGSSLPFVRERPCAVCDTAISEELNLQQTGDFSKFADHRSLRLRVKGGNDFLAINNRMNEVCCGFLEWPPV